MPITLAIVVPPIAWRTRHNYLRSSQKTRSDPIAPADDALDLRLSHAGLFLINDRLVDRGIKPVALIANSFDAQLSQCLQESLVAKRNTFGPWVATQVLGQLAQGAVQVVDCGQQLA
jgi:hypothetical protein